MWTYTATVLECRLPVETPNVIPTCVVYALDPQDEDIFTGRVLQQIVGVDPPYKLNSGMYYVEWGYGSHAAEPTVYQVHRIGDLPPEIPPMNSFENMELDAGGF